MIFPIVALLLVSAPASCDIGIDVFEGSGSITTSHCVNIATKSVRRSDASPSGPDLQPIKEYEIRNDHLQKGKTQIADAVEILVQARANGLEVVVIRNEYNSFSNPLRILAAVAGHPAHVSEVIVLALSEGRVVGRWRLARAASSYEWRAALRKAI
jgi:hypothetical protein